MNSPWTITSVFRGASERVIGSGKFGTLWARIHSAKFSAEALSAAVG
jgi:hypothetical protein